jgi:cyclohexanecarboxylate-CoA ligase
MLEDFLEHAAAHPDKAAIVTYRDRSLVPVTLTYGQLAAAVERISAGLLELGIGRDDVVSIQLPNGWEFAAVTLAALRIGAVVNPLVAIYRRRELEFMLDRARSKILFVPESFRGFSHAGLAEQLVAAVPSLRHAVVVTQHDSGPIPNGLLSFDEFFVQRERTVPVCADSSPAGRHRKPDEIISLMYTSGTTGEPKGTLHTGNTLWSAGNPLFDSLELTGDDVAFMASTLGHLTGFLWGMLQPLSRGMKVVFQDIWDPAAFLRLVSEERVTWTLGATPFVVDAVEARARQKSPVDLSSLRYFVCAGAPVPSFLPGAATSELGAKLLALWGTSECGICVIHSPQDGPEEVSTSDGKPTPVMQVKIVDEFGEPVTDGRPGRLLTRGPSMFVGYLERKDLYDSVVDPDGWFDTGDVGFRTRSGGVRISGRTKDIIIRGGENIPVVEIEDILYTHPKVREVAVVGYSDDRLGERACAVVVPVDTPPELAELTTFLNDNGMAKQYWPERLEIRSELPRTAAGKIQKFKLRDELKHLVGKGVFETAN